MDEVYSAEFEWAKLVMEWRDVQSRINDVLKETDDLKADGDDTAEIENTLRYLRAALECLQNKIDSARSRIVVALNSWRNRTDKKTYKKAENEDTSGIEVKLVKCLQDKIDSIPITILFKRMQVPVSSETVVKDDCSNLIEESCSEVSVEERTIPEFLFDENSEDPSVVNIVQITPEIDNRHCNCRLVQADTIEETPLVAEAVDAVENVSAVTREAPVSSLERGVRFLNPTHEQIEQAQKDDDILNQVYSWVSKGEKPEVIQAGRLPQELWLILVSRFSR